MTLKAVFFDLDGTLLDTAPDLAHALNKLLTAEGRAPLKYHAIRKVVSDGANAMLKLAFKLQPDEPGFDRLRSSLLSFYLQDLAASTKPFAGIEALLQQLSQAGISWGVVTNKPWAYTEPLMAAFRFASDPIAVICPEHVGERKPAPESLLLACQQANCCPEDALYIGDHLRDIQCGINAGMPTIAVGYGYINDNDHHESWNASHSVNKAKEIWPILKTYL
ncbi:HAD family hydrolase [Teredinibacter franksiae]|uniref:HAD family hydrolase n=1 Tax=Teredinibacter franksiae TaxID=2761453 RepID=UPI00162AB08F|nr:HAD-IA family hydrolase [Teredinibacter franksiae]